MTPFLPAAAFAAFFASAADGYELQGALAGVELAGDGYTFSLDGFGRVVFADNEVRASSTSSSTTPDSRWCARRLRIG